MMPGTRPIVRRTAFYTRLSAASTLFACVLALPACTGESEVEEPARATSALTPRSPLAASPIDVYDSMHHQAVIETMDEIQAIAFYDGNVYFVSNGVHPWGGYDIPAMAMYQKSYNPFNNTYGPGGVGQISAYPNGKKYVYKGLAPTSDGVFTVGNRQDQGAASNAVLDVWAHGLTQFVPLDSVVIATGAATELTDVVRGPIGHPTDDYVFVAGGTLGSASGQAGFPLDDDGDPATPAKEDCFVARFHYDAAQGFSGETDPNNFLQFGTTDFEELFSAVFDPVTHMLYVVGKTNGNLCAAYPNEAGSQCKNSSGMDGFVAGIKNEANQLKLVWILQIGSEGEGDLVKDIALYRNAANSNDVRLFIAGATSGTFGVPSGAVIYENPAVGGVEYQDAFLAEISLKSSGALANGASPLKIIDSWGGDYGDVAGAVIVSGDQVIVAGHSGGDSGHIALCDRTEPSPGSDLQTNTEANSDWTPGMSPNLAPNARIDEYTPYIYTFSALTRARIAERQINNRTDEAALIGDTGEQIMDIAMDDQGRIHVAGQVAHAAQTHAFKGARGTGYNNDCADGLLGVFQHGL